MAKRQSASRLKAAKEEVRVVLVLHAKKGETITYKDLAARVKVMGLFPYSSHLHNLLGEISREEDEAGRGMLSVLVVRQKERLPGERFFALAAEEFGRDTSDPEAFWHQEKARVCTAWRGRD